MKSSVAMRFSAAASTYDGLADVQRKAAERLMVLLGNCQVFSRILEIGCGTGLLTVMLARSFPSARIDAVDISPAMAEEAGKKMVNSKMVNFVVADARDLPPSAQYSLIASSCALHWITPIELVIGKLGSLLEQNGRLAFAVMVRGTLDEINSARNRIAPHKPPRVTLPTETDVRKAINKARLALRAEKSENIRHKYPSAVEMLKQLHDQGLTGGNIARNKTLLTRSEISRLITDYTNNYKNKNGVYATYRVFYCVAAKNKL